MRGEIQEENRKKRSPKNKETSGEAPGGTQGLSFPRGRCLAFAARGALELPPSHGLQQPGPGLPVKSCTGLNGKLSNNSGATEA